MKRWIIAAVAYIQTFILISSAEVGSQCRDRSGNYNVTDFEFLTCATCYQYLFPEGKELRPYNTYLVSVHGEIFSHLTMILADSHNLTTKNDICKTLSQTECERWAACCQASRDCCQEQVTMPKSEKDLSSYCPRTWDGFSCWADTSSKTDVSASCPSFLQHASPSIKATKYCNENGTWFKDPMTLLEWTNYTPCLNVKNFRTNIIVSASCHLVSLCLLIPSTIIFLAYKPLRSQHRIRLHINLFLSFILQAMVFMLWDLLVVYDRLVKSAIQSVMHANTGGCKFLYVLTRYSRSCNFLWMFLEGFYLHRLIVKAFEPPRSLFSLYIAGWGIPWLPVTVYSVIHVVLEDKSCWVEPLGEYEWIIYIPNLISLAMNVFFLGNILRILMTQIQVHPNEPSNYRRALKATIVLVPLFGLQLIFIIYRPPPTWPGAAEFEIVSDVVTNLQGFFVALIFCFLNSEVMTHLRKTLERLRYSHYRRDSSLSKPTLSCTTQITMDPTSTRRGSTRSTKNNYIPMKAVS